MAKIRSTAEISKKWVDVTPQRTTQYASGVATPLEDWGTNTAIAEPNFEQGVQAAVAAKRFGKGVTKAGTAKWKAGTTTKGVQRWGPGVQVAQPAYATAFAPFRDAIEATQLPPRFPRGDSRNYERVRAIGTALNAVKVGA